MVRFEPAQRRGVLVVQVMWFSLWVAVTSIALWLHGNAAGHGTHTQLGLPPCPSMMLFGRPCPGCGLTTSFTDFVHLNWVGAFRAHPFGPLIYLAFTASAFAALFATIRGCKLETNTRSFNLALVILFVSFFAFGVARFSLAPKAFLPWTARSSAP